MFAAATGLDDGKWSSVGRQPMVGGWAAKVSREDRQGRRTGGLARLFGQEGKESRENEGWLDE